MNKFVVLASLLLLHLGVFAQDVNFRLGVKAGGGIASLVADRAVDAISGGEFAAGDAQVSFHAGGFARLKVKKVFVQPELYYSTIGSQAIFKQQDLSGVREEIRNYNINRIDVPLLAGIYLGDNVRIGVGPVVSAIAGNNTSVNEKLNNATLGFQAGIGVDIKKFGIDLRYEGGISKISDGVRIGNTTFESDQRLRQFLLSFSYSLF